MNNDKRVNVVDWRPTPRPFAAKVAVPRRYGSPTLIGVIGTLLIHALAVPSAYLSSRGSTLRLPETQRPGTLAKSKGDSTESLVLITLPNVSNSKQAWAREISSQLSLGKRTMTPVELEPMAMPHMDILTLDEQQDTISPGDGADGAEQARLFGIYTGQIRARIGRIWRQPRTPVNEGVNSGAPAVADDPFQCQVQIVQDGSGRVQEILLPQCNGSQAWRRSLVMAIEQASPLPAPPSARVFSHSIALHFVAPSYVAGGSNGD
jgi:TonB C terminal